MSYWQEEVTEGDPRKLLRQLREKLKTQDSEVLREHIVQLSRAWGIKVRLPAKSKVA
jgi:hypothetical protein